MDIEANGARDGAARQQHLGVFAENLNVARYANHQSRSSPFGMFCRFVPRQNALVELLQRKVSVPAVLKLHFMRPSGSSSAVTNVSWKTEIERCKDRAFHRRVNSGNLPARASSASALMVGCPVLRFFCCGKPRTS